MDKEFKFAVDFGLSYGSFTVDAKNIDEAYNKAIDEILDTLRNLPVQVDFNVECIEQPDEE